MQSFVPKLHIMIYELNFNGGDLRRALQKVYVRAKIWGPKWQLTGSLRDFGDATNSKY